MDDLRDFFGRHRDTPPTWTDAFLCVSIAVLLATGWIRYWIDSWPAVIVGFLLSAIWIFTYLLGRGNGTSRWQQFYRISGWIAVIFSALVVVGAVLQIDVLQLPARLVANAAIGGLVAYGLFLAITIAFAGEVSGWRLNRS